MVALADVRRWDAAAVEDVDMVLGRLRDTLLDRDADLTAARPPDDWSGTASGGARAEHDRLAERLRRVTAGVAGVRPAVAGVADAVLALRRDLAAADGLAAARGFAIAADGTVTDVRRTVVAADQVATHQQQRVADQAEILALLEDVLRRATDVDESLADLLARAAAEQLDDGTATTLADAAGPAERQAALFRSLTGHDPVTDQDRRVAATLDAHSTGPPANLVVARIAPVPGAGLVHGGAFIAGREVLSGPPEWTNLGDDRGFDPNAGPGHHRMAFLVDYENGLVVVRQNPSRSADGTALTGVPEVGVEQGPGGAVRLRMEGADPLTAPISTPMGWTVRSELVVDPHGGPPGIASVDGVVGPYPSWEAYHSTSDGPAVPVLQREQDDSLEAAGFPFDLVPLGDEFGPATNLPFPVEPVGPHPGRLEEWQRDHHPDQAIGAVAGQLLDDINPVVDPTEPFDGLFDERFHDFPMAPVPAPTPDGAGGLRVPDAPRVGR